MTFDFSKDVRNLSPECLALLTEKPSRCLCCRCRPCNMLQQTQGHMWFSEMPFWRSPTGLFHFSFSMVLVRLQPSPRFFLGAPVKGDASNLQQCQQCSIIYFIADNFGVNSSAVTPSPWFFSACLFARFSLLNLGTWMVNISIVFWAYCIWMFLVTWNSGRVKSRVLESWCEVLPIFPSMSWEQILCKL